ncbi:hypothetical protein JKP88DRAFT_242587 [Tribonema minus]|uniref:Uncharacterized protein n=1 Tax=Tribonema minus TaxID=303371 RepID=A0A835ZGM0_9STRA|nr:hypothetical protein JKP88DRAFT_242587 [Tribonema minus]
MPAPACTSRLAIAGAATVPELDVNGTDEAFAGQAQKRARVLDKLEGSRQASAEDIGKASAFELQCTTRLLPRGFSQAELQNAITAAAAPIVNGAFNALATCLDARFQAMDGRFDAIDGRLDAIIGRLDTMTGRLDTIAAQQLNGRALAPKSTLLPLPNDAGVQPAAGEFPGTLEQLAHLPAAHVGALLGHYGLQADGEGFQRWERLAAHIGVPSAAGAQRAARHANSLLEDASGVITPVPYDRHRLPAADLLPAGTAVQQLMFVTDPQLRLLLQYYGLSTQGSLEERGHSLRKHLGVRRTAGLL